MASNDISNDVSNNALKPPKILKNIESEDIIRLLSVRRNYQIRQINGERVYGPPIDGSMVKPPVGSEIYIYQIPCDCSEDELVPFFERVGQIYQLRIKIHFSGYGRGYAYVQYSNPFVAQKAVQILNGRFIRDGTQLMVNHSYDNKELKLEEIDIFSADFNKLKKVLEVINEGAVGLEYSQYERFVLIKYRTHHLASMARRRFFQSEYPHEFQLEWVSPKRLLQTITSFWIRLPKEALNQKMINTLLAFEPTLLRNTRLINGMARVSYPTRREAEFFFDVLLPILTRFGFELCWDWI